MPSMRRIILYVAIILICVYSFLPIYSLLIVSLMDMSDVVTMPGPIYAINPSIVNFFRIFGLEVPGYSRIAGFAYGQAEGLKQGLFNICIIAPAVMAITMIFTVPAGYVLGRYRLKRKNLMIGLLLGSRTIPGVSVIIPYYFLFALTGLRGTHLGVILVHLTITIPVITWILMGFFATLPVETERAARIDGCSAFEAFRRIVLPMAAPGIAATAVLSFLYSWNDFLFSWVLSGGTPAQTYNSFLTSFFHMYAHDNLFAAAVMVQMIPAIIVSALLQRYIVQLKIVDPVTVVTAV